MKLSDVQLPSNEGQNCIPAEKKWWICFRVKIELMALKNILKRVLGKNNEVEMFGSLTLHSSLGLTAINLGIIAYHVSGCLCVSVL